MDKYLKMFKPAMMKYLRAHYEYYEAQARWEKTVALNDKWKREDGALGGRGDFIASNMLLCYAMCAFYENTDKKFSSEDYRQFTDDVFPKMFGMLKFVDMNKLDKPFIMKCAYAAVGRYARRLEQKNVREWGSAQLVRINPDGHKTGFAYALDYCPLYEFALKHGYEDFLPNMCAVDHKVAAAFHARLIRHELISAGDKVCKFWYVGDKSAEALADSGLK